MVPWMMASAIAIEIFFSTCGACASAGEVARTDKDASTARRTRRMLLASLKGVTVSRPVEPSVGLISPGRGAEIRGPNCRKRNGFGGVLAAFEQARFKPIQLGREIGLDIADPHLDHAVVARLQPRFPAGAVSDDGVRLVGVDQLDRQPVHKGDEIGDMAADR